jgi:hypothetical protein
MTATMVKLVIRDVQAEGDRDLGEFVRRQAVTDSPHVFLSRVLTFLMAQGGQRHPDAPDTKPQ